MKLIYTGPRKKEFGIVGPSTGVRHTVRPGEVLAVPDEDGKAILQQYPSVFDQAAPEPRRRSGKVEPVGTPPIVEPGPELFTPAEAEPEE